MQTRKYQLCFGDIDAATYTSEASYLDALRHSNRPVKDASFRVKNNVISKTASIKVHGIVISAAAGCPVHIETTPQPQYSLVIPYRGSGSIRQGRRTFGFFPGTIIRSSYQNNYSADYDEYSGVSISTDIDLMLDALKIPEPHRERATERLLDTELEQLDPLVGGIDYDRTIRSVVRMIDAANCDAHLLERIGFHQLLTNIIADLTLKVDKRLADLCPSFGHAPFL